MKDISNADGPSATFTVVVQPGTVSQALVEYNGTAIATNSVTVAANTPVALTVVNADSAGDPVPVLGSTAETVNLSVNSRAGVTGGFITGPGGSPSTSVQLQPGQSAQTIYFESTTAETLNANTDLTATRVAGVASSAQSTVAMGAFTAYVAGPPIVNGTGTADGHPEGR